MPLPLPENRTWWELECPMCKVGFCTFIETQIYCSFKCKDNYKHKINYKRKPLFRKNCPKCNKVFKQKLSNQIYCSRKCQKKTLPTGNRTGRPTLYKDKYCKMLIKHMASGMSYETFGATIDVCKSTVYKWEAKHPEFLQAKKIGFQKCQEFWEKMGIHGAAGKLKNFNAAVYIYNCKNRFRKSDTFGNDPDHKNNNFNFNLSYDPSKLKDDDA